MISVNDNQFEQMCYFWNDWLRLMSFGGEYTKLKSLLLDMKKSGVVFDKKFYYINMAVGDE